MREAMDKRPVEELLERFRRQMRACGLGPLSSPPQSSEQISKEPLTGPRVSSKVPAMSSADTAGSSQPEIQASVKMPIATHEALRALAQRENRTLAGQIRHAIDQMVADAERIAA